MFLEIEINTDLPDQIFTVDLDKRVYTFRVRYNFRAAKWTLSISTEAGELLVAGVPLVSMWPFMKRFKDARLPVGELFVRDLTGGYSEPGEDAWGVTHLLLYKEA